MPAMIGSTIGLMFAGSIAVDAVLSPLGGRWGDRRGRRLVAVAGLALSAAAVGLLALLRPRGETQRFTERGRAVLTLAILAVGTVLLAWLASQISPAWANRYLAVALPTPTRRRPADSRA